MLGKRNKCLLSTTLGVLLVIGIGCSAVNAQELTELEGLRIENILLRRDQAQVAINNFDAQLNVLFLQYAESRGLDPALNSLQNNPVTGILEFVLLEDLVTEEVNEENAEDNSTDPTEPDTP